MAAVHRTITKIGVLGFLSLLVLGFQNCGKALQGFEVSGELKTDASSSFTLPEKPCTDRASAVRVGAIRWDAWNKKLATETSSANDLVLTSLGNRNPKAGGSTDLFQFKNRWPYFAGFDENGLKSLDSTGHIAYEARVAQAAGVDYWAFLEYDNTSSLSTAIKEYEQEVPAGLVNFALILNANSFVQVLDTTTIALRPQAQVDAYFNRLKARLADNRYEKLASRRPLIYVFDDICTYTYGTWNPSLNNCYDLRWFFNRIRDDARSANLGEPYFVYLSLSGNLAQQMINMGLQAVSNYALGTDTNKTYLKFLEDGAGGPHQDSLVTYTNPSFQIVFPASSGWNPSPRFNCVAGDCWNNMYGNSSFAEDGTAAEVANGIYDIVKKSEGSSRTELPGLYKTVLVYAWNEYDEGGWLSPTINSTLTGVDQTRASALAAKLKPNCPFDVIPPALKK